MILMKSAVSGIIMHIFRITDLHRNVWIIKRFKSSSTLLIKYLQCYNLNFEERKIKDRKETSNKHRQVSTREINTKRKCTKQTLKEEHKQTNNRMCPNEVVSLPEWSVNWRRSISLRIELALRCRGRGRSPAGAGGEECLGGNRWGKLGCEYL